MELTFILKKVISAFLMPLPFTLLLALLGLFFLYRNKLKKAKIFLSLSIILISIFSYVPFSNLMLYPLETQYKKLQNIPQDIKYILLLGGDQKSRGWEALRLYNQIANAKIITSGYQGRGDIPEALKTAQILQDLGISKDDIIIHPKPKDTQEEAIKMKEVLKDERFILITSAYHMPRAMMIFENEDLYPIPAPTDFLILPQDKFLSTPMGKYLKKTQRAWHEYIGIIWLKLKGKQDKEELEEEKGK